MARVWGELSTAAEGKSLGEIHLPRIYLNGDFKGFGFGLGWRGWAWLLRVWRSVEEVWGFGGLELVVSD